MTVRTPRLTPLEKEYAIPNNGSQYRNLVRLLLKKKGLDIQNIKNKTEESVISKYSN